EGELKKKANADDPIVKDKLEKIEKSLDEAVEGKAKLDAAIEAEKKEREALEMKMNRLGVKSDGEAGKREVEIKEFNNVLANVAAEQKRADFKPLDDAGYDAYKSAFNSFMRRNERQLTAEEVKT